jgi:hypothetical protein
MIKFGNKKKRKVDSKTRALLIRKGNEFFNSRNIEASERIFVAVDYKDGLIRLGDHYLENKNIYKACEMYYMSENSSVIEAFLEKSAKIIEKWLKEDDENIEIVDKIIMKKS